MGVNDKIQCNLISVHKLIKWKLSLLLIIDSLQNFLHSNFLICRNIFGNWFYKKTIFNHSRVSIIIYKYILILI